MMVSNNNVSPQRPDIPARFESLNDDTLSTTLEFVGDKSYKSFGGINKQCREIYLSSGMTKKTFLCGYAPLSVIKDKIEKGGRFNQKLHERVGKGVVLYNRRDLLDWAFEERNEEVIKGICDVAAEEGRIDLLEEVWSNVNDRDENKIYIFKGVDGHAAGGGKLNVLEWAETKVVSFHKFVCAMKAASSGHIQILQWLHEEKGLQLGGYLYIEANYGGQLHVIKWLREQEVPWDEDTFYHAAFEGNLDVLQWLHDEGCPWPEDYLVYEYQVKPEALDWCRVNGYGNRIVLRR